MMETTVQMMRDMRVFLMLVNFLKVKKVRGRVMRSRAPIAMARYLSGSTESQIMTPQIAVAEEMKIPKQILEIKFKILFDLNSGDLDVASKCGSEVVFICFNGIFILFN